MPRLRRTTRRARSEYTERHVTELLTGDSWWHAFPQDEPDRTEAMRAAWDNLRDFLLPDFISAHPSMRPWAWWAFDAPEPRRQVLSDEEAGWEALGPADSFGCQHMFRPLRSGCGLFPPLGVEGDADDDRKPMYETQLAYLKRLGLLSNEERDAIGM